MGFRIANAQRDAWRFVGGFRGTLPDVSHEFLRDMTYDVYYDYAKTTDTERQNGASAQPPAGCPAVGGVGRRRSATSSARTSSAACVSAIGISSITVTNAQMAGAQASVSGTMFDMPAGPGCLRGRRMALDRGAVRAGYLPGLG